MQTTLIPILALVAAPLASAQLLVPQSTNDDVMMFDAFDGSLINMQFLDMNISTGTAPSVPQELIFAPNGDILISDQTANRVFRYSSDGSTYIGETTTPLANVRGIESAYGFIWVANSSTSGGAPGNAIVQLDLALNLVQTFPLPFAPWDLQAQHRGGVDGLLVTDLSGHNIQYFDPANPGTLLMIHDSDAVTGIDFPQYMRFRESNGNLLVGGFSPPSGVYEYDPITGMQLNFVDTAALGATGIRAVHELGNGNLLISGPGVRVYDPVAGTLTTIVPSVAARAITKIPGSSIGTNYCTAVPNSTGSAASMSASGSASVVANNLVLRADNLPLNAFGYFLTSLTQGFVQNPGGSQGNLCLGGSIGRYVGTGQVQNSGATGAISLAVDLTQHPTPTGPVSVQPGETWHFTAWHRDMVGGMATSNFADGYSITFN